MKPDTRTVTQLFELDVRYVVPFYQRPYVWDQRPQDPLTATGVRMKIGKGVSCGTRTVGV